MLEWRVLAGANEQATATDVAQRLRESPLWAALEKRAAADDAARALLTVVQDAAKYAHDRSKMILRTLPEYTLHDGEHLFRVLFLMGKLLQFNEEALERFSAADLALCIISCFFHDLGLAPTPQQVSSWRAMLDNNFTMSTKGTEGSFSKFLAGQPMEVNQHKDALAGGNRTLADRISSELIGKYIRATHGARVKSIIKKDWEGRIRYGAVDLTPHLSFICESHTLDASALLERDRLILCGDGIHCSPITVAVLLRLADILDFDSKRAPKTLMMCLDIENGVSLSEWHRHQAVKAWRMHRDHIAISAQCSQPMIEEAVRDFCDTLEHELVACSGVLAGMRGGTLEGVPEFYRLILPRSVDRSAIGPVLTADDLPLYQYRRTRFELDRDKIIDLLMGTSLYGQPAVALRELLQNSLDACRVRQAFETAWNQLYSPELSIKFERTKDGDFLIVEDNGMGMDASIITNFYAKVGASYYRSAEFYQLRAEYGVDFTPISRFGIGVLSYFLVADNIEVQSKRLIAPRDTGQAVDVKVNSVGGLFWISDGEKTEVGTTTRLALKKNHPWSAMTPSEISKQISSVVPEPPTPISLYVSLTPTERFSGACKTVNRADILKKEKYRDVGDYGTNGRIRTLSNIRAGIAPGISAELEISWLEKDNAPVKAFTHSSKIMSVLGEPQQFMIESTLEVETNTIRGYNGTIDVEDDTVRLGKAYHDARQSSGIVVLHGIKVPVDLFDERKAGGQYDVFLRLPFVLRCVISITTPADLNLNAARSDILPDNLWFDLRDSIVRACIESIRRERSISPHYFRKLLAVWEEIARDEASAEAKESSAPKTRQTDPWIVKVFDAYRVFLAS